MQEIEKVQPWKTGDKLMIEVMVTDGDISTDYLIKAVYDKIDTSNMGIEIKSVIFAKDRYIKNLPNDLRDEIQNEFNKFTGNINELISKSEDNK